MTGNGTETRGVIVVVDYHSHLPSAVDVAIALANSRRLALRGLFLEDPDLASVCSLPFIQEVTLAGARPRALEQERLRRTLQGFNRRFRQLLSQGAERAALEYSVSSVHGRRQSMELGGELNFDYLVLGQPGVTRQPGPGVLRVLMVGADMDAALPVLDSLQSPGGGRQLELLLLDGDTATTGDGRLRKFIEGHRGVTCQRLQAGQLAGVFRLAGRAPDLVVASRRCQPELLKTLLKLAACPVILSA
jgi:hypothetical protein